METLMVLPVPRRAERREGTYVMPERLTIAGLTEDAGYAAIAAELGGYPAMGTEAAVVRLQLISESQDGTAASDLSAEELLLLLNPEGYVLIVSADGIDIWAAEPAGHLYGVMTLKGMMRQYGSELPCLIVGDAPAMKRRGMQLAFAQGMTEYRASYMENLVRVLAGWKINELYLYLETFFDFPSLPRLGGPGAMTADDARTLDKLCRAYNIKLIPQLNLLAHSGELLSLQRYHHLTESSAESDYRTSSSYTMCASSPEADELADRMLGDLFDCFSSDVICVGGDEVENMGECPLCKPKLEEKGKIGIYVDHFSRIMRAASVQGRKIGIWGDMLISHFAKATPDERQYAVDVLLSGTIIYDWSYDGGSFESLQSFKEAGFETVACSSTHLCYSSSVHIGQHAKQLELFADAAAAGTAGGMTTAWCNAYGLHEEQMNFLVASGATALWSGADGGGSARSGEEANEAQPEPRSDVLAYGEQFERAYSLQRYGLRETALTAYWHALGDPAGAVLGPLAPLNGVDIRKCLYHTDNVLMMWKLYAAILRGEKLAQYEQGIQYARGLWDRVAAEADRLPGGADTYLPLQEGSLLMHEHLLRRFRITEEMYALYDKAAKAQYRDAGEFGSALQAAAARLLEHLADFTPVEAYLTEANRMLGLEKASLLRLDATKRNMKELADFLGYLAESDRPLPAFVTLHDVFLRPFYSNWFVDRQHEWAAGPERFRRYSVQDGAWKAKPF
ncbi:beta-N-acetylhexosaminidase [Paenibacillus spongiae]|uniref:beta-N-acetylhexosaminidase n=1 Tax=Paenibacillus spongiae TaxID=2909671 RepID=A0ABY5S0J5_9BACL|nr:beta-N-acetylhexosaminidase [Paenibacillus spongiae]UVI27369.1 beta-N-acetylhexosaminidase [Paenibacillus spongiae]